MIYLKFLAVVPANVGACAHGAPHVREDVRDRYKVFFFFNLVISLYGGCRVTDFSVNLPLSATQVHVKGPFILYNSWLYVEKKRFFLPLVFFHLLQPPFFLCASLISSSLPTLSPLPPCIFPHATPRRSRVYPVSRTHWRDVCTETTYKNQY